METFQLYGLRISSEVTVTLEGDDDLQKEDVLIRYAAIDESNIPGRDQHYFSYEDSTIYVRYKDVATCRITPDEIAVDPAPNVQDAVLTRYLVGPALAASLHLRGAFILHASGAVINDEAVLFLGESGRGKSTLATWARANGHQLLTDDVAVVRITDDEIVVEPGPSFVKLHTDSARILGGAWDEVYGEGTQLPKPHYLLSENVAREAKPLKRIYALDEGDETRIERLDHRDAFRELVRNTYVRSYLDRIGQAEHLEQCGTLVNSIPVGRLTRPLEFTEMPTVFDTIKADLEAGGVSLTR